MTFQIMGPCVFQNVFARVSCYLPPKCMPIDSDINAQYFMDFWRPFIKQLYIEDTSAQYESILYPEVMLEKWTIWHTKTNRIRL